MKTGVFLTWITATSIALIFALKPQALQLGFEGSDKLLHLLAFMCLTFIPVMACKTMRSILLCAMCVMTIGIGIEMAQTYIPSRQAEFMDIVFNTLGVSVGIVMAMTLKRAQQIIPVFAKS